MMAYRANIVSVPSSGSLARTFKDHGNINSVRQWKRILKQ